MVADFTNFLFLYVAFILFVIDLVEYFYVVPDVGI